MNAKVTMALNDSFPFSLSALVTLTLILRLTGASSLPKPLAYEQMTSPDGVTISAVD